MTHLLELYLTPLNAEHFRIIVGKSDPQVDGNTDSVLPFWESGRDWRTTIIKTLESNRFQPDDFPDPVEQDWMVRNAILAPDRQSFHPAYLETIGEALYESLLPPESSVREAFKSALRNAEAENKDLHLRLKFPSNSTSRSRLADYPWELLHNQVHFLQHRWVQISRYIAHETTCPVLPTHERIQVLLVTSCAADIARGLYPLQEREEESILAGISKAQEAGLITFEQIKHPTRKSLSTYLTECTATPQILHFDGHGLFGKKCSNVECRHITPGIKAERCGMCGQQLPDPKGYLVFEKEDGGADFVSASSFATLLPRGVELVVLSACQSGMALGGESIFNGTAQQLIDARIPAVVAMQYSVQANAASNFAEQFYRVLGQKKTLLEAISAGRKWMEVDSNQWYRPVLYLRWQDNDGGSLFLRERSDVGTPVEKASERVIHPGAYNRRLSDVKTGRKLALLIGVSQYGEGFLPLPGAVNDIEELRNVLQSEQLGGFDEVQILTNPDAQTMRESIETLFTSCTKDDLLLLFFSGHGVKDSNSRLYFGTFGSKKTASGELVKASSVSAGFIHDIMEESRSEKQVIILDCCFSGAFPYGLVPKDDTSVDIKSQLGGTGRAILTSSTAFQNSFSSEGQELSFYTQHLVDGIRTGEADLDKDQVISAKDINEYIQCKAKEFLPSVSPALFAEQEGAGIYIAKAISKGNLEASSHIAALEENEDYSTSVEESRGCIPVLQDSF